MAQLPIMVMLIRANPTHSDDKIHVEYSGILTSGNDPPSTSRHWLFWLAPACCQPWASSALPGLPGWEVTGTKKI